MVQEIGAPLSDINITEELYDFERAMEICGFGIFNIFLLFASLPGLWATVFETTTMSYVLPAAECDLKLTLLDKGLLNAITFAGMLLSAFPWGFIADCFGRKYTIVSALLMQGSIGLFSVISINSKQLMTFKFFGGFMACGSVAVFVSYISEFHHRRHRVYMVIAIGFINALAHIILPSMAAVVLPIKMDYKIGPLEMNSWKTYIAITALPAIVSGLLILFFPESPKFLMSQGRNDEALKAFELIYAFNKFQKKNAFPMSLDQLKDEAPEKSLRRSSLKSEPKRTKKQKFEDLSFKFKESLYEMHILVHKSNRKKTIMACAMFFFSLLSVNSIRLWRPQHFTTAQEMEHKGYDNWDTCDIISYSLNKTHLSKTMVKNFDDHCEVHIEPASYTDSIIICAPLCFNYILTAFLVKFIGNNVALRIYLAISCLSLITDYWSTSRIMILALSCIFFAFGVTTTTLLLNASINLYPTSVRTMAVMFLLTCGRCGSVIGNVLLPYLMSLDCSAIFAFFSATILCTLIITIFLPNTTREALK